MTWSWISFFAGIPVGVLAGAFILGLCMAAKRGDRMIDEVEATRAGRIGRTLESKR